MNFYINLSQLIYIFVKLSSTSYIQPEVHLAL